MKIYLVGIKGAGMSSLAQILLDEGYEVRGSDTTNFINTEVSLKLRNVVIDPLDSKEYLNSDIVIIGHYFYKNELIDELNVHKMVYFEYNDFLSLYLDQNKLISVCGSHGKTTLVKLLSSSFEGNSYLCGEGQGKKLKEDLFFFLESCEYKRHFLKYHPKEALITNIELDHVDYYKDEDDYTNAYQEFIDNVDKVYCLYEYQNKIKHKNIISYGLNPSSTYYLNKEEKENTYFIKLYKNKELIFSFNYKKVPNHFLELLCADLAFYHEHNYDLNIIIENIKDFKLPYQRFNVEHVNNHVIVNDYCHHPSQIKYNLEQCKFYFKDKKYVAIFKVDRTSRLVYFKKQYIMELEKYDYAFVFELSNTEDKSSHSAVELTTEKIKFINSIEEILLYLKEEDYVFSFMSSKDQSPQIRQLKKMISK